MKKNPFLGNAFGKVGDLVVANVRGEQITRKYQPSVFNPNTTAQIESRAKLKLISQLSAVMAPVIAFKRTGLVSARNKFTKANYGTLSYSNNTASVDLTNVTLTGGIVALPAIVVVRDGYSANVSLNDSLIGFNRVVYICFRRQPDGTLRYLGSTVVSEAGETSNYPGTVTADSVSATIVVYAYAIRDNTEVASVMFSNLDIADATLVANVIASSKLTDGDITLTETRAIISTGA